jgi:hypothetical protein
LERLNGVHCEFLERLERDHPELKNEIEAHQQERLHALHPPNVKAEALSLSEVDPPAAGSHSVVLRPRK